MTLNRKHPSNCRPPNVTNDCAIVLPKEPSRPKVRVTCGDITELEVDGFVFFARPDLKLGSGFGGTIARRGGSSIQKELREMVPQAMGDAVLTSAGKLKATFIVHAVGPVFQEEAMAPKLKRAVLNALCLSEEVGAKSIAFPPMGTGFYGIPVGMSASVMVEAFEEFARQSEHLKDIIVCVGDPWMAQPYEAAISS